MSPITPEVEMLILAAIRAGSRAHAAAAAAGVPFHVYRSWMQLGRERTRGRYRQFWLNVCQARSQARTKADIEARQKDVKFWLRHGAGSTTTSTRKGRGVPSADDFFQLLGRAAEVLLPFPEARRALLQAFDQDSLSAQEDGDMTTTDLDSLPLAFHI